ncbi:hypothetical protein W97_08972 [Coniosporium apollinis CBS 100218]|uniref:Pre-mRNA-processing factor 19 n=1 Tax=Coniosporium apollinis (strain CBS 100218) TaxID=1168221 RepID=R7Z6C2_CONA1|nr:uncharacterized protein W97_08972 [Coniosporium apollinis CBS 100218]EON69712.1 hypothetical protein W97_08972 [Coniosporium apollinis CBS 100218]
MLCAISGEAPQVPVASRKSGNVFEKRLIEAYIAEHGSDPVNGEELSTDDLVELKTARIVRPRPPTLTSIPALLSTFQNEWDAVALETFQLKQQLAQTRQELSTALYQNDAATRVIARLQRERDEARDALSKITISAGGPAAANGDAMQVDNQGLPEALVARVQATQQKLSSTRRKRPVPEGWASAETIQSFDSVQTTDPLYPQSRTMALDETRDLVLSGGAPGSAAVYSISMQAEASRLSGVSGSVTAALWFGSQPVLATSTGDVDVFEQDGTRAAHLGSHAGAATSLALHPSGDILASTGVDKSFILYDLSSMTLLTQVFTSSEITCGKFHPDGHLFAAGLKSGKIQLFQTENSETVAEFDAGGPLHAISFSENGTWLAAAVQGETSVSIWDLRKQEVIKVLDVGSAIEGMDWDYTGQFLAVAGPGCVAVEQYSKASKSWSELVRKAIPARAVQWGPNGYSLVALTAEGALMTLGAAA